MVGVKIKVSFIFVVLFIFCLIRYSFFIVFTLIQAAVICYLDYHSGSYLFSSFSAHHLESMLNTAATVII